MCTQHTHKNEEKVWLGWAPGRVRFRARWRIPQPGPDGDEMESNQVLVPAFAAPDTPVARTNSRLYQVALGS